VKTRQSLCLAAFSLVFTRTLPYATPMNEFSKLPAKKSLGQHFLTSPVVPGWMCDAANVQAGDTVLEIGPGTGVLTKEILRRGAIVVALEADSRAIEILKDTFVAEITVQKLTIIHGDVRTLDTTIIPGITDHSFKLIANIPYYLSGLLFRMFLEGPVQPTTLVYLVQKEVAKRATSSLIRGEKESLLSLSVKAYGTPKYIKTVTRGHFTPPPKVDSGIIAITGINRAAFSNLKEAFFFEVLHLGFGQKRKQLLGNLAHSFDRTELVRIFNELTLPETIRAEDVPITTWLQLVGKVAMITS
jgi:16S rRNA (adenine1518-N6/adenine1519-N6)-dimethyltransferase